MSDKLSDLRERIDEIDDQILGLLKDRVSLMKEIGEIKKQNGLSVRDSSRETKKIEIIKQKAVRLGVPADFVSKLWGVIFKESEEIEI